MTKVYEYHKRNDYPGERIAERKRVEHAKAVADDRFDQAKSAANDKYDDRVARDNNKFAAKDIADQEKYDARVSADNRRFNEEVDKNREGGGAFWMFAVILLVIGIFVVGFLWGPWNQPKAAAIPNTQSNTASDITPAISLTQAPTFNTAGQSINTEWNIDGSAESLVTNTAVHYGDSSLSANALPITQAQQQWQCASVPCSIPGRFSEEWNINRPGNYYYR